MHEDDMRAVLFTAETPDGLIKGLESIPGYKFSWVGEANRHPLMLISPSGSEIYLRHVPGSTSAATSNILPQDHDTEAPPFEKDEATILSEAATSVAGLRATLELSNNDRAKLKS